MLPQIEEVSKSLSVMKATMFAAGESEAAKEAAVVTAYEVRASMVRRVCHLYDSRLQVRNHLYDFENKAIFRAQDWRPQIPAFSPSCAIRAARQQCLDRPSGSIPRRARR